MTGFDKSQNLREGVWKDSFRREGCKGFPTPAPCPYPALLNSLLCASWQGEVFFFCSVSSTLGAGHSVALKPTKQYAGAVLELTSFVSHSSGIAAFSCPMSILLETMFLRFVLILVVFGRRVNWSLFHLTWLKSKVPSRYHLFFFFFQVKLHTSNSPFKNFNHLTCTIQWL